MGSKSLTLGNNPNPLLFDGSMATVRTGLAIPPVGKLADRAFSSLLPTIRVAGEPLPFAVGTLIGSTQFLLALGTKIIRRRGSPLEDFGGFANFRHFDFFENPKIQQLLAQPPGSFHIIKSQAGLLGIFQLFMDHFEFLKGPSRGFPEDSTE